MLKQKQTYNYLTSDYFRLCKGVLHEQSLVHQGAPLVLLLFNICINGSLKTLYVFLTTLV